MMKPGFYIGVMSGTSLDGVDAVLADISESNVVEQGRFSLSYPAALRKQVLAISQGQQTTLSAIGHLDHQLGSLYAQAINGLLAETGVSKEQVIAVGCHGQTVWHEPDGHCPFSLQLGDNNRIVALTGSTTVGDFRRRDMAYGGQGAPLVPAFHSAVLGVEYERRVIVNIGGISNISILFPNQSVIGYDTGPGNMLIDAWIKQQCGKAYDEDGVWAKNGQVNPELLAHFLSDPYFSRLAPKSTGREYFNLHWLEQNLTYFPRLSPQTVQSTLTELTAITIGDQVSLQGGTDRLMVCGGGAKNVYLMARLAALLPDVDVVHTDEFGLSSMTMEALAFAWLAARTMSGLAGNLPQVTGASQETVLGAIYPANS